MIITFSCFGVINLQLELMGALPSIKFTFCFDLQNDFTHIGQLITPSTGQRARNALIELAERAALLRVCVLYCAVVCFILPLYFTTFTRCSVLLRF